MRLTLKVSHLHNLLLSESFKTICPVDHEKFYWHCILEHMRHEQRHITLLPSLTGNIPRKSDSNCFFVIHRGRLHWWVRTRLHVNLGIKGSQLLPSSSGWHAATYKITHTHIDQTPSSILSILSCTNKSFFKNQLRKAVCSLPSYILAPSADSCESSSSLPDPSSSTVLWNCK